jgi:hypothetical protein
MASMRGFVARHAVACYYILTFTISWGGILLVAGPGGIPGAPEQVAAVYPAVILALLAGPSISGLFMTGLVHGRAGLRDLLARLLRWRVGARWYAVALLTAPLTVAAVLFTLALTSPVFLPAIVTTDDKASLLLTGVAVGLVGGLLEELGWTGFAIPELRRQHGILATGLFVGILWGVWHLLVTLWLAGNPDGTLSMALYLPSIVASFGELPAYRVLMVWVYDRTHSLLLAILMHASLIFSTLFVLNSVTAGAPAVTWHLLLAVVLWIVVAAVAIANHGQISRQPLRGQMT